MELRKCINNKEGINVRETKTGPRLTINQLKLSIAMELKCEGYSTVIFDKLIEACGRKIRVHVYCEDELGLRMAVYCINKSSQIKPHEIFDIVELVRNGVEDCDVALAFPLALLPKAQVLIGLTTRVYTLDDYGRVWIHYPSNNIHRKTSWIDQDLTNPEADEGIEALNGFVATTQMRLSYVV
jgi:hypothetical protein